MRTNERPEGGYADPAALVDALGYDEIGKAIGVPAVTVRGWKYFNHLPRRHWPEIMLAFDLTLQDMLATEKGGNPRQRERQARPKRQRIARRASGR